MNKLRVTRRQVQEVLERMEFYWLVGRILEKSDNPANKEIGENVCRGTELVGQYMHNIARLLGRIQGWNWTYKIIMTMAIISLGYTTDLTLRNQGTKAHKGLIGSMALVILTGASLKRKGKYVNLLNEQLMEFSEKMKEVKQEVNQSITKQEH